MASTPIINPSMMSDDENVPRWPNMDPAKRCIAHKPDGSQCQRARKPGTTVCEAHGSAPAHVKAAAARNVADQKAIELASRIHVDMPRLQSPGEAASYLLGQVQRRAVQMGQLADQLQTAVYTDRAGQERVRAILAEERRWLDSMTKLLGVAAAAKPAEPAGPSPVELFTMAADLFREDVGSALADCNVYGEQHQAILAALADRTRLRLKLSATMIIEQVRTMADA
jgi:hypothetical protein